MNKTSVGECAVKRSLFQSCWECKLILIEKKKSIYQEPTMTAYINSWINSRIYTKGKIIDVHKKVLKKQFIIEIFIIDKYINNPNI